MITVNCRYWCRPNAFYRFMITFWYLAILYDWRAVLMRTITQRDYHRNLQQFTQRQIQNVWIFTFDSPCYFHVYNQFTWSEFVDIINVVTVATNQCRSISESAAQLAAALQQSSWWQHCNRSIVTRARNNPDAIQSSVKWHQQWLCRCPMILSLCRDRHHRTTVDNR